jgi:DNA-binding phage protein
MSSQSRLDIIFRTLKQGSGDKETMSALQGVNSAFTALTGVSLAGAGAITAVFGIMQRSITTTLNLANEVRNLSRMTGLAAEEASGLYQIADDVQISNETLTKAMRYAIDNGYNPSIESLAAMSNEYLSLENGADRTRYAIEHFGTKAGTEMARLLELGGTAIRNMADSAAAAGQIFTAEDLQNTRNFELALDDVDDAFQGMKIALTRELLPGLIHFIEYIERGVRVVNLLAISGDLLSEVYEEHQQALRATNMVYADYVNESIRAATEAGMVNSTLQAGLNLWTNSANGARLTAEQQVAVNEALRELGILTSNQWEFKDAIKGTGIEAEALGNKFDETNDVLSNTVEPTLDLVNASFRDLTSEILYNRASAGLDGQAALELARSMGLLNDATYNSLYYLQQLRQNYDANGDGAIDATEAQDGYTSSVLAMDRAIKGLTDRHITITVDQITNYINHYYTGGYSTSADNYHWNNGASSEAVNNALGQSTLQNNQRVDLYGTSEGPNALGDSFIVPSGYSESLGTPYLVSAQSGERVKITPSWQKDNSGEPIVIQVYLDSQLITQKIADRAHQQGVG